jgi:predicted dinucleotide-binding enzyme
MRIGIIGTGNIGQTLARHFVDAGHEVAVSNSRGPDSLAEFVDELGPGARAATVAAAAEFGDLLVEAIPFGAYETLPADALAGKILVSASNYYPDRDGEIDFGGHTQTGLVAAHLDDSRVVKAFNTMYYETLRDDARPDAPFDDRLALFVAGDDADAKSVVTDLIEEIGFTPVDAGTLADSYRVQPGSPVYNEPMVGPKAERRLGDLQRQV